MAAAVKQLLLLQNLNMNMELCVSFPHSAPDPDCVYSYAPPARPTAMPHRRRWTHIRSTRCRRPWCPLHSAGHARRGEVQGHERDALSRAIIGYVSAVLLQSTGEPSEQCLLGNTETASAVCISHNSFLVKRPGKQPNESAWPLLRRSEIAGTAKCKSPRTLPCVALTG